MFSFITFYLPPDLSLSLSLKQLPPNDKATDTKAASYMDKYLTPPLPPAPHLTYTHKHDTVSFNQSMKEGWGSVDRPRADW